MHLDGDKLAVHVDLADAGLFHEFLQFGGQPVTKGLGPEIGTVHLCFFVFVCGHLLAPPLFCSTPDAFPWRGNRPVPAGAKDDREAKTGRRAKDPSLLATNRDYNVW
jgi:hypothetical protein